MNKTPGNSPKITSNKSNTLNTINKKNQPTQSPINYPCTSSKNTYQPTISSSQTSNNKPNSNNNTAHETLTHTNGPQRTIEPISKPNNIKTNTNINFASVTAMESTPSRQQAIVFNSIDGIPQKEYELAIGKIVKPINIIFISKISNNRFCIFLSSKQVLDNLMQHTQSITINDHNIQIRRLINPAKRIILSNVWPSIPNRLILDELKNIDISPTSQLNYLKAGINMKGYEHIMSFRRQMYINNEDISKLPSSLIVNYIDNQFRIFFTDDTLTCFFCKSNGHTSNNFKINLESKPLRERTSNQTNFNVHNDTSETLPVPSDTTQSPPNPTQNFNLEHISTNCPLETDPPTSLIPNQDEALASTSPVHGVYK